MDPYGILSPSAPSDPTQGLGILSPAASGFAPDYGPNVLTARTAPFAGNVVGGAASNAALLGSVSGASPIPMTGSLGALTRPQPMDLVQAALADLAAQGKAGAAQLPAPPALGVPPASSRMGSALPPIARVTDNGNGSYSGIGADGQPTTVSFGGPLTAPPQSFLQRFLGMMR